MHKELDKANVSQMLSNMAKRREIRQIEAEVAAAGWQVFKGLDAQSSVIWAIQKRTPPPLVVAPDLDTYPNWRYAIYNTVDWEEAQADFAEKVEITP